MTGAETMTVNDALAAMLALYTAPSAWTRDCAAQDAAGKEVAPTSPEAVAWSLEGALYRVVGDPDEPGLPEAEWRRREALARKVFEACGADLAALNDTVRHQRAVVAVLRAGLARVHQRGGLNASSVATAFSLASMSAASIRAWASFRSC